MIFVNSHQCKIIHKITVNRAIAIQSLNKLSPSKIVVSLRGIQTDLKIDNTATGSVAEISEPKSKQTKKGIEKPIKGKRKNKLIAIKNVEIKNQNIDNNQIDFQFKIIRL